MGHIDIEAVSFALPDGRMLLDEVSFRVAEGCVMALVGANGAGKTTLLRLIAGDLDPDSGTINRSGGLGIMRQFIGSIRDDSTVHDLLVELSPPRIRQAARELDRCELALMDDDSEPQQLRYASALAEYADAGGYDQEVLFDVCCQQALGQSFATCRWRDVATLSGGEQKRLALELLLRGPDEVLLLDEPDNYLDVPGKRWLEQQLLATKKSVLLVSHDRELLAEAATSIAALELGASGNSLWVHGGSFTTFAQARCDRFERFEELRRRWDEKHAQLKRLVRDLRQAAANSDALASKYQAACTRLDKFEQAGPPQAIPLRQEITMRLSGARTGKRSLVCEELELTGLMRPFSTEIWFGDRVGILGSNGSGKSHFLRLLACGGSLPDSSNCIAAADQLTPVAFTGSAKLGARVVPGLFAQTHEHPELIGKTLLEIIHRGDDLRQGLAHEQAARALDRYELAGAAHQCFETLSGGQQARVQILLLELSGVTMLLLDEPTDNLDLDSAEALEAALAQFEGTVLAVTHDRWFAKGLDRFLIFGSDGVVYESACPVWDETRVQRLA
ncbi:MAG: ABC-F family ATP-binding cassette domain-containing protein [Propionibacteriaceae bacterium]